MGAGWEDAVQTDRTEVSLGLAQEEIWERKVNSWKLVFLFSSRYSSNVLLLRDKILLYVYVLL